MTTPDPFLEAFDWFDHPDGPKFVETHRNPYWSVGHWLFLPGTVSRFHRVLNNHEIWAIHQGRLLVHVLDPALRTHRVLRLGPDPAAGEQAVVTVPAGHPQAAELPAETPFAFGSNVCAPPFSFDAFEVSRPEDLLRDFPAHPELIRRLTAPPAA